MVSIADLGRARYSRVQPGTAMYRAETFGQFGNFWQFWQLLTMTMTILETCDIWDTGTDTENWEPCPHHPRGWPVPPWLLDIVSLQCQDSGGALHMHVQHLPFCAHKMANVEHALWGVFLCNFVFFYLSLFVCILVFTFTMTVRASKCLESANVVRRRAAPPVPVPPTPGLVTAAKVANVSSGSQRDPQVAPLPNAAAQKCNSLGIFGIVCYCQTTGTYWSFSVFFTIGWKQTVLYHNYARAVWGPSYIAMNWFYIGFCRVSNGWQTSHAQIGLASISMGLPLTDSPLPKS